MRARRGKYNARPTILKGIRFASAAEASRYLELCILERAGEIRGLRLQPRYPLVIGDFTVGTYVGDFQYHERAPDMARRGETWRKIVEDVKGVRTDVYRLKVKLLRALYGLEVREVTMKRGRRAA